MALDRVGDVAERRRDRIGDRRTGDLQLIAHRGIAQGLADRGEARVERIGELAQGVVNPLPFGRAERGVGVEPVLEAPAEIPETFADLRLRRITD